MLFCRIKHKKLQIPKYTPRILPRFLIRCSAAPEHDGTADLFPCVQKNFKKWEKDA